MKREVDLNEISDGRLYSSGDMVKVDCHDCEGCSACCQGMGNSILLDPMDLWRLQLGKKENFDTLLANYLELNVVDGMVLPNLKMAGEEEADKLTNKDIAITMAISLCAAILLFVVIPTASVNLITTDSHVVMNLWEGLVRMIVFFLYIYGISRAKDIQRVFQYHGAEHKTIHAYEAGVELIPENVQKFSRLHPRCGTSFLLIVMIVSIFMFSFLGWPSLWERIISRVLLLPVVAGISYELIRFAGRSKNKIVHAISLPGLWLQYLTTREPDDSMIEVAVKSLKAAIEVEETAKVETKNDDTIDKQDFNDLKVNASI